MAKTILITGSTDGIGLETAKMLVSQGAYACILHGRNLNKTRSSKTIAVCTVQVKGVLKAMGLIVAYGKCGSHWRRLWLKTILR